MKTTAQTLTDAHVADTKQHIEGNVADHLINEARNAENGYYFYLTEKEIEEFETDDQRRQELVEEVENWIRENYDHFEL